MYKEALRAARDLISAEDGVVAPLPLTEEEINPEDQDDQSVRAFPVESMDDTYPVSFDDSRPSDLSEFSFFQDGRQRTLQIGFIPAQIGRHTIILPVHFYVVAAVILQRRDRKLSVWNEPILDCGVMVQRSLVPNQAIMQQFEDGGLRVIDTGAQGGDYYTLRKRALQEAKKRRLIAEDDLIRRWQQSDASGSEFLVVDGTLMNFRNEDGLERCIGVSKSFGTRYFDISDHNRVMSMPEGTRSWVFKFHPEESDTSVGVRERLSWYLRLRTRPHTDPEFGMVRVELSPRHESNVTELAERFSRSILSDRLPTSYPKPRWHNHLYPIAACERYLSSVMPPTSTIQSSMRGLIQ